MEVLHRNLIHFPFLIGFFLANVISGTQFFSPELCCGETPLPADGHRRCCGNVSYSPFESMCCWEALRGHYVLELPAPSGNHSINSILSSAGSRFLACCGDRIYDFRFYTCCDGVTHKQSAIGNTGCCGTEVYDPYAQLCCDGHVLPKGGFSSFCCGAKSYDNTRQVCCGETVYDVSMTTAAAPDAPALGCCGDRTYNATTQLCCSKQRLQKATQNSYCCGTSQFDWESELCCDGRVFSKTSPTEFCCGSKPYDTTGHLCCQDNVIPKKRMVGAAPPATSGPKLPHSKRFHLLPVDSEDALCCGNQTYNFDQEICCQGRVVPRDQAHYGFTNAKCCGAQPYNEDTEICCEGRISPKVTRAEDCCGSLFFNVQTQVCCQGVIHHLNPDSLLYCCGNSTFDPENETCCHGKKTSKQLAFNEA